MKTAFLFFLSFLGLHLSAQETESIQLINPSFEDYPRQGHPARGWSDCGFEGETPPDIQPSDIELSPFFEVRTPPADGNTYMGMVVRDNNTWESVGQAPSSPLLGGHTYRFSIQLAQSEWYVSQSRTTHKETNYTTPAILRIYGGPDLCSRQQLLAESPPVQFEYWSTYTFELMPEHDIYFVVLSVEYAPEYSSPYNGHILVDNCSEFEDITPFRPVRKQGHLNSTSISSTDPTVEEMLESFKEYSSLTLANQAELPYHIALIQKARSVQNYTQVQGLRQYLLNHSSAEITQTIEALEAMKCTEATIQFKEAAAIYSKYQNGEVLTATERAHFDQCDQPFTEALGGEDFEQKIVDYITFNKEALVEEFSSLN
ncbi:MAG: hypothetical protein AAGH79_09150 [Bacteroidota bacterium]